MPLPDVAPYLTVADVVEARYGGRVIPVVSVVQVGTTITRVLRNNPARIGWVIANRGAVDVSYWVDQQITVGQGFAVPVNGVVSTYWEQDGELPAWEVHGIATVANTPLYIIETVFQ